MRLRQLKSFIVVCELGSITRAAEQLHVAQPALGLQVRGLEDEFGAQLLERNSRGVQVTLAGKLVLNWARQTVNAAADLKSQLREMSSGLAGTLTLGLTPSTASLFALPILAAVEESLPKLRLQLVEGLGHFLKESLLTGRIDLALVFDGRAFVPEGATPVLMERLYFVSAASAEVESVEAVTLEEVLEHPLALPTSKDSIRNIVESAARSAGLPFTLQYEVQSLGVILNLVKSGLACTLLPLPAVAEEIAEKSVSARPIESPALERYLYWLHGPEKQGALTKELERVTVGAIRHASLNASWAAAYTFYPGLARQAPRRRRSESEGSARRQ